MSRTLWVAAGVFGVLLIGIANTSGGRNSTTAVGQDPVAQAELKMLRERVAHLEVVLGAKLVKPRSATTTMFSQTGGAVQRPTAGPASAAASAATTAVAEPAMAAAPVVESVARVVATQPAVVGNLPERTHPPPAQGVVPMASWWSDKDVKTASGEWCRKPPPYAAPKPPLPELAPGSDKPLLTTALAKKHASSDNLLIATYVNYNRLDFAYTFVKHLLALNNPHFLVGALDEKV